MEEFFMSLDYLDDVLPLHSYEYSFEHEYKGEIYIITVSDTSIDVKKKGVITNG